MQNTQASEMNNDIEDQRVFWSSNKTKVLIDLYSKYRSQVGTLKIRTMKMLWSVIATELNQIFSPDEVRACHCENKWKVLDRCYKKYIEGTGRREFPYAVEMENIYAEKRYIIPTITLSAETSVRAAIDEDGESTDIVIVKQELPDYPDNNPDPLQIKKRPKTTDEGEEKSNEIIIKQELPDYREDDPEPTPMPKKKRQRVTFLQKLRKEELVIKRKKLEIEIEKIAIFKKRNELLEEYNSLLAKSCHLHCKCQQESK